MKTSKQVYANMALEQLLVAYAQADINNAGGGAIDWCLIDTAVEYAKEALPGRFEELLKLFAEEQTE